MKFKDEFLDSMPVPRTYACDPHKHSYCRRSNCAFNLDIPQEYRICDRTIHAQFKWNGVSERVDHYGETKIIIKKEE